MGLPGKGRRIRVKREETDNPPIEEPIIVPVEEPEPVKVGA